MAPAKRDGKSGVAPRDWQDTLKGIPPDIVEKARKTQQAAFLDRKATRAALEIFKTEDRLKNLVFAGRPKDPLSPARPRPVNPDKRVGALKSYLFLMFRRNLPQFTELFEPRLPYAVATVNDHRRTLPPESRAKFDAEIKDALGKMGCEPEQFGIHFPEIVPRQPYAEKGGLRPARKRRDSGWRPHD